MNTLMGRSRVFSSTTSIVARMGAWTVCSVTPYEASTSIWPSAVAPPWLPMAGTMNGCAPRPVHVGDGFSDDGWKVVDAAASNADRDAGSRLDQFVQPRELFPHRDDGIAQPVPFESLPDLRQSEVHTGE